MILETTIQTHSHFLNVLLAVFHFFNCLLKYYIFHEVVYIKTFGCTEGTKQVMKGDYLIPYTTYKSEARFYMK